MTGYTTHYIWAGLKYFTDLLTGFAFVRCLDGKINTVGEGIKADEGLYDARKGSL